MHWVWFLSNDEKLNRIYDDFLLYDIIFLILLYTRLFFYFKNQDEQYQKIFESYISDISEIPINIIYR